MITYYLMPFSIRSPRPEPALIRKFVGSAKTVRKACEEYQRELNGGKTFEEVFSVGNRDEREAAMNVVEEPYSIARESKGFSQWPGNQEADL